MSRARTLSKLLVERRQVGGDWQSELEDAELVNAGRMELAALLDDLTEARLAAIRERETRRLLLDVVPVAVLLVEKYGLVRDANQPARELLGADVVGHDVTELLAFDDAYALMPSEDVGGGAAEHVVGNVRATGARVDTRRLPLDDGSARAFLVILPRVVARSQDDDTAARTVRRTTMLGSVRVLVVEDDPDGRAMLAALFESNGATVFAAANGIQALAILEECAPDVIVSDIVMPEMNGYTFIRQARSRGCDVPALALTGLGTEFDAARARDAGYDAHLAKPVESTSLLLRIRAMARGGVACELDTNVEISRAC